MKFSLDAVRCTATEDVFETGETGPTEIYIDTSTNQGVFTTFQDIRKLLRVYWGVPFDCEFEQNSDDPAEFIGSYLTDDCGTSASTKEIESWKQGDMRLWADEVTIRISVISARPPEFGELDAELG